MAAAYSYRRARRRPRAPTTLPSAPLIVASMDILTNDRGVGQITYRASGFILSLWDPQRRKEKRGEKGGKREGEKKRKGRGRRGFVVSYGFYHKLSSE